MILRKHIQNLEINEGMTMFFQRHPEALFKKPTQGSFNSLRECTCTIYYLLDLGIDVPY